MESCRGAIYLQLTIYQRSNLFDRFCEAESFAWGAVNDARRLFNKNTGLCKVERRSIGADTCPVLVGQLLLVHGTEILNIKFQISKWRKFLIKNFLFTEKLRLF